MERQQITEAVTAIIRLIPPNENNSANQQISETVDIANSAFPHLMEGATDEDIKEIIWRIGNHLMFK